MTVPGGAAEAGSSAARVAMPVILLVGILMRLNAVCLPFDHRLPNAWRQADYFSITRNFDREGMNILYPRIDWRRDTPGYAEMELPIVPWVGAALYRVAGPHVQLLRGLTAGFEILALLLFARLAAALLPPLGALFALSAFAVNPLLVLLAGSIQPDPLLNVCALLCVTLLWRWRQRPRLPLLLGTAACAAAAMLVKLPAAYLGLMIAYVVVRTLGVRAVWQPSVIAAALLALLPPAAWYTWAHGFWLTYGSSLGLSNESHWIGWDILVPPTFLVGIATWETIGVFTPAGTVLALAALRLPWSRIELPLLWLAAVGVFYVAAGRTTGDRWAYYYHSLSVAPGALLMGAGFWAFSERLVVPAAWRVVGRWQRVIGGLLGVATVLSLLAVGGWLLQRREHGHADYAVMRGCLLEFAPLVPFDARIVVRGGAMVDEHGHPVAYNESMAFAWMDRRGFNYGAEELSIATLDAIAARGGRYWVANRGELADERFAAQVDGRYRRLAACADQFALYDLRP